jgi:hypothetical protein
MVREEDIRKLARSIWEAQGCPDGKHLEHYFCAKLMLEERDRIQEHIDRLEPRAVILPPVGPGSTPQPY